MNSGGAGAVDGAAGLQTAWVPGVRISRLGAQAPCGAAGAGAAKAAAVARTRSARVKRIVLHISISFPARGPCGEPSYKQECPRPDGPGRPAVSSDAVRALCFDRCGGPEVLEI